MSRKSSGKQTTPISTAISTNLHQKLIELAAKGDVTVGRYCRAIIEDAVKRSVVVKASVNYEITREK